MNLSIKKIIKDGVILVVTTLIVIAAIRIVVAGSLTPNSSPASTMKTLQESYDVLVGNFDSSGLSANYDGNAIQVAKCAATRITGGICP